MTERPSIILPLCVLGAGIVHGLCIVALLPMLIAVPDEVESRRASSPGGADKRATAEAKIETPKREAAKPEIARVHPPTSAVLAGKAESDLVTGSLAAPAATRASLIAALPREALKDAQPVPPMLVASSGADANLVLAAAEPEAVAAIPSQEEIEAGAPQVEPVAATEEEVKPAPSAPRVVPASRKASPPAEKRQVRARAPVKAAAPAPRRQVTAPVRRAPPQATRQPQPRAPGNLGLGLFFPKPQGQRQQAVRR